MSVKVQKEKVSDKKDGYYSDDELNKIAKDASTTIVFSKDYIKITKDGGNNNNYGNSSVLANRMVKELKDDQLTNMRMNTINRLEEYISENGVPELNVDYGKLDSFLCRM
jgi:hypothetical protein